MAHSQIALYRRASESQPAANWQRSSAVGMRGARYRVCRLARRQVYKRAGLRLLLCAAHPPGPISASRPVERPAAGSILADRPGEQMRRSWAAPKGCLLILEKLRAMQHAAEQTASA